jgi:hypothetical protein
LVYVFPPVWYIVPRKIWQSWVTQLNKSRSRDLSVTPMRLSPVCLTSKKRRKISWVHLSAVRLTWDQKWPLSLAWQKQLKFKRNLAYALLIKSIATSTPIIKSCSLPRERSLRSTIDSSGGHCYDFESLVKIFGVFDQNRANCTEKIITLFFNRRKYVWLKRIAYP